MIQTHAPKPLTGPLRARINRLAHAQALHHEMHLKALLLEQVQTARDGGASFDELTALVDKLEAEGGLGLALRCDCDGWAPIQLDKAKEMQA